MISTIAFLALAAPPPLTFSEAKPGHFVFDTGAIRGRLRADGKLQGIAELVDIESGVELARSKFPGILALYRLLAPGRRLGDARIMAHAARIAEGGGAVAIRWPPTPRHPVELGALFRLADPRTIDLEITCRVLEAIPAYEVFISSYPTLRFRPFLFMKKALHQAGPDRPIPFEPVATPFIDGCYLVFPRDYADARPFFDGRWRTEPHPVQVAVGHHYAAPLVGARDPDTGLALVIMAERKDCFALLTAYSREPPLDAIADHNSIYLNLGGRDVAPGDLLRFHLRAYVGRLREPAEALALARRFQEGGAQARPSSVGSGPGSGKGAGGAGPDAKR